MKIVNVCVVVGLLVIAYEIGSGNSVVIGYVGSNYSVNRTDIASVLMAIDDAKARGIFPNSSEIV